jgi:WD40 repeat protein
MFQAWDVASGRSLDAPAAAAPPHDPTASPNGRWRAQFGGPQGGWELPVRLLDSSGGLVASLPTGRDVNVQAVAFSADGTRLIGGGWDVDGGGLALVWDVPSGREVSSTTFDNSVFATALSGDGRLAAVGTSGGPIAVWTVDRPDDVIDLEGHEAGVQALAFAPGGRRLVRPADLQ